VRDGAGPGREPSGRARAAGRTTTAVAVVALVAVVAGLAALRLAPSGDPPTFARDVDARSADLTFVIPPGTSQRIQNGETVDLIPSPLIVSVGDTIRIRNLDRDPILLGPFYLGAHQTLTQRFVEPGRYVGDCMAHPTGRLVVKVRP
jgi:hypothetical protein